MGNTPWDNKRSELITQSTQQNL